jgi:tetratricopeptide (TPR) repeat protein
MAGLHNGPATATAIRTTDGTIALRNVQAQIEGLERYSVNERLPIRLWVDLIDLLALRGELLGRIGDYEQAAALAEQLVADAPAEGITFVARARTRATFHRFGDALADLDQAERRGIDPVSVMAERAAALHQLGRAEEALALARASADRRPGFPSLAALAVLHAERGEAEAAETLFAESRACYRSVSPFPLALLDFQRGRMWLGQDDPERARGWFAAAAQRVPAYVPAQGHLAEADAALGNAAAAIARLRPLTISADDPDYAAQFARILGAAGQVDEARMWRTHAAARYEDLIARHPAAFADHAAEFWLGVGGDPQRALGLARLNAEARRTPRAVELLVRAALASAETEAAECRMLDGMIDRNGF